MAVLGIISVLATAIFPANTIFLFLFSTLFTYICVEEYGLRYGLLTYAVIASVGVFILPNKISAVFYAAAAGYYPAVKHIIERLSTVSAVKWILKLAFAFAAGLASYMALKAVLTAKLPAAVLFAGGLVLFIIYDFALTYGLRFYALKLRKYRKNI